MKRILFHKFVVRDSSSDVEPTLMVSLEQSINRYLNSGEMVDMSSQSDSYDFDSADKVDLDAPTEFGGSRIDAVMQCKRISSLNTHQNGEALAEQPADSSGSEASHKSAPGEVPNNGGEPVQ